MQRMLDEEERDRVAKLTPEERRIDELEGRIAAYKGYLLVCATVILGVIYMFVTHTAG